MGGSRSRLGRRARSCGSFATAALFVALAAFVLPGRARSASAAPGCTTRGLVVWLDTQGNGAAGSIFYRLEFTNLSGHACTIRGYPGVSAVALGGRRLGSPASRNAARPIRRVTLRNGASANAVLQIVETGNYPDGTCRSVTAAALRVYPPDQTAAKLVPFPFGACSRAGPHFLMVQPVQPGTA